MKVVNVLDPIRVLFLREQSSSNKHVSWHPSGSHIAVSCTDGVIYVYSLTSEEPELIKKVDGVIRRTEAEDEASTKAVWCPDGRAFAAPTATRDIVVVDREGWERQRSFAGTHTGEITDLCWSPNGAFLASAGKDGKIVIWESRDMKVVATYDHNEVCALAWHPTDNTISFTTTGGKLFTRHGVVPDSFAGRLALSVRPAPLNNDTEKPTTIRRGQGMPGWAEPTHPLDRIICESSDSEGSVVGDLGEADANKDWLEDDDNAGYGEPSIHGKRKPIDLPVASKRPHIVTWSPDIRGPFQPTATPWVGERRYMCLNMIGCVWTVNQGTHNTVSVEFYDHETHRDFRFTDRSLFDKACLNENGTLFSSQPDNGNPAGLWYRPHETWDNRSDWRINLPGGESITSITLSENYIVACTSNGYVRTYTLFGVPYRIYRPKNLPVVTCASYRDYVLTMGNGPVGPDGTTLLTYTIENIKRDEVLQNNDVVALPLRGTLKSVFFSEKGDPMIYDSDGVLLVLQHWREPGQARWTPLLDTRLMERLADGARTESYWPVGVAQDKFHCIILKV